MKFHPATRTAVTSSDLNGSSLCSDFQIQGSHPEERGREGTVSWREKLDQSWEPAVPPSLPFSVKGPQAYHFEEPQAGPGSYDSTRVPAPQDGWRGGGPLPQLSMASGSLGLAGLGPTAPGKAVHRNMSGLK